MSRTAALRSFKLFVLAGFPLLAFLYAYQFIHDDREHAVPFQTFRAPLNKVSAGGRSAEALSLPFRQPVTVVNFWASWCAPCVEEFPAMIELQRQLQGKGVELLFVSVDEKWSDVEAFKKRFNLQISAEQLFWDPTKRTALAWGSIKFPETYVVRRDGWVVEKIIGAQQWARPQVIEYFVNLGRKFHETPLSAQLWQTFSDWLESPLQAAGKAPDLIHEEDRRSLDKLRANIDTASKNLRNAEAALKEEKRNLEEQSVVRERRQKEESEAAKEVEKIKNKRDDVRAILAKNTDSQNAEKREKKSIEERIRKIQSKIKELQKDLEDEKSDLQEANKDLNTRVQQIETYDEARKSSQEELEALNKRVSYADSALRDKNSATKDAENGVRARERKARELESEVEKAKKVLGEQKNRLSDFERVLEK